MNNWNFFHQTDEDEKEENGFGLSTKPYGMTDQEEDEDTQVKPYDPATNIKNKLLAGAEKSGLKQDTQRPEAPKIALSKPQNNSKAFPSQSVQEKAGNAAIEPSMKDQNNQKLGQTTASPKARPPAQPPKKPNLQNLVSDDAKADNANIAKTLLTKSSEISGLPPLLDHMLKEDSLGGKAVIDDLVSRVRVDDPETAEKLQHAANPIMHKYGKAIQVAQANLDAQYQRDLAAYQQRSETPDPIIDDQSNDDILYGSAGNDILASSEETQNVYPRPLPKPEEPEKEVKEEPKVEISPKERINRIIESTKRFNDPAYTEFMNELLGHEGGYTEGVGDPGGPTQNGVSTEFYKLLKAKPDWKHLPDATKDLTPDQVNEIYYKEFFDRLHFDKLLYVDGIKDTNIAEQIFDFQVNTNTAEAGRIIQKAIESLADEYKIEIDIRGSDGKLDGIVGKNTRDALGKILKRGFGKELNNHIVDARLAYLKTLGNWQQNKNGWPDRIKSFIMN